MEGLILTEEDLRKEVEYFLKQDAFAWDTETMDGTEVGTRGMPTQNRVVWISLATHGRTIVVPMGHPNGNNLLRKAFRKKNPETGKFESFPPIFDEPPVQLRPSVVFEILEPLFFNENILKIAHNAPFDFITVARYYGRIPSAPMTDTIVLQWLLNENIGEPSAGPRSPLNKGLKTLTKWYYRVDYDKEEVGKKIELHPFNKVARYALLDARYTWLHFKDFTERVHEGALDPIRELEDAVTEVCCHMGLEGAPVDVQAIEELKVDLSARLEKIEAKIYRAAGKVFNINSVPQKKALLFGKKKDGGQGLKVHKYVPKTKNPSTDAEALKPHKGNPLVDALLEYQEINKILGTYVLSYLGDVEAGKPRLIFNGKIHTDLVQYGTTTGRFSSRAPNLQNIPAPRSDLGKKIRGLFRAPKGYKFLVADYAQMELRILASYIGHGGLYEGFHAGVDAHTQTASLVYGIDPELLKLEENKWMRNVAKTLNFAIVYGAAAQKVADTLGITKEEAEKILANHRKAFPEIYKFLDSVVMAGKRRKSEPHIRTILGRKRRVWELDYDLCIKEAARLRRLNPDKAPSASYLHSRGERQIVNSLIQGSLGDIIKLAMVRMHKLTSEDAKNNPGREIKMILSVHDELVILCPEDRVEEGKAMLLEAMSGNEVQDLLNVPLAMTLDSIAVVDKWSEAKE